MGEIIKAFLDSTAGTITAGGVVSGFAAWTLYKLKKILCYVRELYICLVGRNGRKGILDQLKMSSFVQSFILMSDYDGVAQFDSDGDCLEVNQPFADLLGIDKSDCIGQGWLQGISASERQNLWDAWHKAIESQVPFEYRADTIEGKKIRMKMYTCWATRNSNLPIGTMCRAVEVK